MKMFHGATAVGSTIAQIVSYSPSARIQRNTGIRPPLKNIMTSSIIVKNLLNCRCRRLSTNPPIELTASTRTTEVAV